MTESSEQLDALCRNVVRLLDAARGPVHTLRVVAGDAAVELIWPQPEPPVPGAGQAASRPPEVESASAAADGAEICAPTVGTFYRSPEPGSPPFVTEGDLVEAGQQVAILEAMKLMNPIEADRPGRITKIIVADGDPVEYGQPLFLISPDS
ncbi:acetyl-CoA carboxylase biotin carboxyl carrier protein [Actinoallomurus vinaceus]|uniref:Biotin carboxyl carrier protein of acetyl-CoA carboxylase n=1 Tax=Actinoallomurus vinaceus TaxID=1080074 RepID=A0ABP8USZ5_9ACTN